MTRTQRNIVIAIVALFVASCASKEKTGRTGETRAGTESEEAAAADDREVLREEEAPQAPKAVPVSALVEGNNQFAFDLLKQSGDGAVAYSPMAVSMAGMILYEGSAGETRDELRQTFRLSLSREALESKVKALREGTQAQAPRGYEQGVHHQIWIDEGISPAVPWDNAVLVTYGGTVETLDFSDTDTMRLSIDKAMSAATASAIPSILGETKVEGRFVVSVGANPRGAWENPFDRGRTKVGNFTTRDGSKEMRPVMRGEGRFPYFADGNAEVLALPYEGDATAFVVLPRDGTFDSVEGSLSYDKFKWYVGRLRSTDVAITLPKVSIASQLELGPILSSMGADAAFEEGAEFRPAFGADSVPVGTFVHASVFEIDEDGTRAQARAVQAKNGARGAAQFEATRPFLVFVRDDSTGQIVMVARVI